MTVAITMRGLLEPVVVDESFPDMVQAMNLADLKGKEFVVLDGLDDNFIAIKSGNILTIKELDDD